MTNADESCGTPRSRCTCCVNSGPAWSAQGRVHSNADAVLRTLKNAPAEGLRPEDFDLVRLRAAPDSFEESTDAMAQNEFDIHLTYSLVRYISQLCFGRVDPR